MTARRATSLMLLVALGTLVVAQPAAACSVCFGDPTHPETRGARNAVLFLLGVVGLVQVGFVGLFWQFRRRSKSIQERKSHFRVLRGGFGA